MPTRRAKASAADVARKKRHCIRGRAMWACEVEDEEKAVARLFDDVLDDQTIESDADKRPKRAGKVQRKTKAHDDTDDYVLMLSEHQKQQLLGLTDYSLIIEYENASRYHEPKTSDSVKVQEYSFSKDPIAMFKRDANTSANMSFETLNRLSTFLPPNLAPRRIRRVADFGLGELRERICEGEDASAIEGHDEGNIVPKEQDDASFVSPSCDMVASMVRLSVDERIAPAATSTPAPIARTDQRVPLRKTTLSSVVKATYNEKESAEDKDANTQKSLLYEPLSPIIPVQSDAKPDFHDDSLLEHSLQHYTLFSFDNKCRAPLSEINAPARAESAASNAPRNVTRISLDGNESRPDYLSGLSESRIHAPINQLVHVCKQNSLISWEDVLYDDMQLLRKVTRKLGEGSYGEVFETLTQKSGALQPVAIKIIPVDGDTYMNGEPQQLAGEVLPEVLISGALCAMRDKKRESSVWTESFLNVRSFNTVEGHIAIDEHYYAHKRTGEYPQLLLDAWDRWRNENEEDAINDRPDAFGITQAYLVLEAENAGQDLDHTKLTNVGEAISIFVQVVVAVACAEEAHEFEHRNVLIRRVEEKCIDCRLGQRERSMRTNGVRATIIDFSNSRIRLGDSYFRLNYLPARSNSLYKNLSLEENMFAGDSNVDYQFAIYPKMRDACKDNWRLYNPYSNVLWMDYLLDRLTLPHTYKRKQTKALKPLLIARDEVRTGKYSSCVQLCSAPQHSAIGALFNAVDFTQ